jgi:hypothetical protein
MTAANPIRLLAAEGGSIARVANQVEDACQRLLGRAAGVSDILLAIRDMPYGRPSCMADPETILKEWRGTCSSKHIVVMYLLRQLGIPARFYMGSYALCPARSGAPPELLRMLSWQSETFRDVHNYVRADIAGGIRIDVTWPAALSRHSYFRVTKEWDGCSDLPLAADVEEERELSPDESGLRAKRAWLDVLNQTSHGRAAREDYIGALSAFVGREMRQARPEETIPATVAWVRDSGRELSV